MKEKIYLVCQRNLVKVTKTHSIWTEFYPMCCYRSFDAAQDKVNALRYRAEKYKFDTVDYRVQTLFIN